ncbi:MAG: hypothetical protein MJ110_04330 [Lachnospiraceae bacterium]|nr:hypothetical protein [Lachnospiraceae bacterium]
MREMEFKMEREGLVSLGEELTVTESKLPMSYYYTVEHAIAMSANYQNRERLKTDSEGKAVGKVVDIKETDRGFFITMSFEE